MTSEGRGLLFDRNLQFHSVDVVFAALLSDSRHRRTDEMVPHSAELHRVLQVAVSEDLPAARIQATVHNFGHLLALGRQHNNNIYSIKCFPAEQNLIFSVMPLLPLTSSRSMTPREKQHFSRSAFSPSTASRSVISGSRR